MQFFNGSVKKRITQSFEPIPVGEALESDWATWADSVGFQDSEPMDFQMTDKQSITAIDGEFLDVFAADTKKSL